MLIHAGNSYSKIISANEDELTLVKQLLSYRTASYMGRAQVQSLLKNSMFPAGLTRKLVKAVREKGFTVELVQRKRRDLIEDGYTIDGIVWEPRPHQAAALDAIRLRTRGLVQHATGCLSGDTIIEANRAGWSFKITIRDLVKRLHSETIGRGGGPPWNLSVPTTVRYRDNDGYIRLGVIKDAYYSGVKTTYILTTECGKAIRATGDHRFLTADGWKPLSAISVTDQVFVRCSVPAKNPESYKKKNYLVVGGLKYHPYAGRRNIKRGGHSVARHRLVIEAALNNLTLPVYVDLLRSGCAELSNLKFLDPAVFAVHHVDENHKNNDISNLCVVAHKEHAAQHALNGGWKHITERTTLSRVVSITRYQDEDTYDIEMADEPHNFIANGFVVHNSGKGDLIGLLAAKIKGRVLIIAPSQKLQRDLYERCRKFEVRAGRLGGGYRETKQRVIVAVDDSLKRLSDKDLETFDAILADEAHGVAATTLIRPIMKCINAEIRLGFSATPLDRSDKKGLFIVGALGETIHRYTPAQAAEDGVISKANLKMVRFWHTSMYRTGDYVEWERQALAENLARNLLITRMVTETASPRIVFTRTKAHQAELVKLIGSSVDYVNDQTPPLVMERIIKKLQTGEVETLVSTPIFRQGIDIPALKTVINAAGGKATIDVIQKVGRGSRILQKDGSKKESFDVIDVYDIGCGCQGEVHKTCEWLHRHSTERQEAYEKYGYEVKVVSL